MFAKRSLPLLLLLPLTMAANLPVKITHVPNYFAQDLEETDASSFDWVYNPPLQAFKAYPARDVDK
jgi:hypothetical protein